MDSQKISGWSAKKCLKFFKKCFGRIFFTKGFSHKKCLFSGNPICKTSNFRRRAPTVRALFHIPERQSCHFFCRAPSARASVSNWLKTIWKLLFLDILILEMVQTFLISWRTIVYWYYEHRSESFILLWLVKTLWKNPHSKFVLPKNFLAHCGQPKNFLKNFSKIF